MTIDERIAPILEKGIAARQRQLVILARKRATADAFQKSDLEESGLRNLLDVARESPHVAVVTNYIHYQVGRDASPRPTKWAAKMTCKEEQQDENEDEAEAIKRTMTVGEWVADDIEHTMAQDLAAEVLMDVEAELEDPLSDDTKGTIKDQAAIRLTRSYIGYLLRALIIGPTKED